MFTGLTEFLSEIEKKDGNFTAVVRMSGDDDGPWGLVETNKTAGNLGLLLAINDDGDYYETYFRVNSASDIDDWRRFSESAPFTGPHKSTENSYCFQTRRAFFVLSNLIEYAGFSVNGNVYTLASYAFNGGDWDGNVVTDCAITIGVSAVTVEFTLTYEYGTVYTATFSNFGNTVVELPIIAI